jgi:hypothetical protein
MPCTLKGVIAGLGIVDGACRNLMGFACLELERGPAIDDELKPPKGKSASMRFSA